LRRFASSRAASSGFNMFSLPVTVLNCTRTTLTASHAAPPRPAAPARPLALGIHPRRSHLGAGTPSRDKSARERRNPPASAPPAFDAPQSRVTGVDGRGTGEHWGPSGPLLPSSAWLRDTTDWRGQLSPASPVLGQKVIADHNPADDLGHIQSDFDICPKAHDKALGIVAPRPQRGVNSAPPERMSRR